jgi:hypothetical protein
MAKASFTRITTKIIVDGRTYSSVEEMPAAVRQKYEATLGRLLADRDGNGVPDVFEAGTVGGAGVSHVTRATTVYKTNGREFTSLDDVPPEFRALLDQAPGHVPHDASARLPNAGVPRGGSVPPATLPEPGLFPSWATIAWLATGLALAACAAYLIWAR